MRLFAVSMVRNEADVLEAWIRYHLQMFDGIVIADHGSYRWDIDDPEWAHRGRAAR
jgi:hypothetical protein